MGRGAAGGPGAACRTQTRRWCFPGELRLRALDELVHLGYFRGIVRMLDEIESEDAHCAAFVSHMRALAREFQLEAMSAVLRPEARDAS